MHRRILPIVLIALAGVLGACGGDFGVAKFGESGPQKVSNPVLANGQEIFNRRCGGCHTFDKAGTEGSAVNAKSREFKDGPNFNQRAEPYQDVLYAIRNGGFSSGPMPQNIAVGREAEEVACFVATYSGKSAVQPPAPGAQQTPAGGATDNCAQTLASK